MTRPTTTTPPRSHRPQNEITPPRSRQQDLATKITHRDHATKITPHRLQQTDPPRSRHPSHAANELANQNHASNITHRDHATKIAPTPTPPTDPPRSRHQDHATKITHQDYTTPTKTTDPPRSRHQDHTTRTHRPTHQPQGRMKIKQFRMICHPLIPRMPSSRHCGTGSSLH